MFENVNCKDAIEELIRECELLLAISLSDVNVREAFRDGGAHVGPKFQSIVFMALLRRKPFVNEMFAAASAEFQCAGEVGWSMFHRIGMIEPFDDPETLGQDLMPIVYEVIAYGALSGRERRQNLRPFGNCWHLVLNHNARRVMALSSFREFKCVILSPAQNLKARRSAQHERCMIIS